MFFTRAVFLAMAVFLAAYEPQCLTLERRQCRWPPSPPWLSARLDELGEDHCCPVSFQAGLQAASGPDLM